MLDPQNNMHKTKVFAAVLRVIGTLLLLGIIISVIPASVPRLFGYSIYNVVSGSMEPAIAVGSAIYVESCDPAELAVGDVAAFVSDGEVVAHRVVENDTANYQLYTKGDANDAADMNPVSYGYVIGKVAYVLPWVGYLCVLYTSASGKLAVLGWLVGAVLILAVARSLEKRNAPDDAAKEPAVTEPAAPDAQQEAGEASAHLDGSYRMLKVIGIILTILLLVVLGVIGYILYVYYSEEHNYEEARESYVTVRETEEETAADAAAEESAAGESAAEREPECPIYVNFDALQAVNDEIIGWIYCEDTVINYPICYSGDDEYYLNHAYDRTASNSGAIFLEEVNTVDFSDSNSILYGHHMKNGSMFACLSDWADQEFYEEHPIMWLLTPDQTYRIDLFAGHITSAGSDVYTVFRGNGSNVQAYLDTVIADSDFTSEVEVSGEEGCYIVLSTCEYSFENARYVLHGMLVPAD